MSAEAQGGNIRQQISEAIDHLGHILPGQAPIQDFVHHNTLHGFEHLGFPEALARAREFNGINGFLPIEDFRRFFRQGRITEQDLIGVLSGDEMLGADEELFETAAGPVTRQMVLLVLLIYPVESINSNQLNWQLEEAAALERIQADVPEARRRQLLARFRDCAVTDEPGAVNALWQACLQVLGLQYYLLHPEEMADMSESRAEEIFSRLSVDQASTDGDISQRLMQKDAALQLHALLDRVGRDMTLREFLLAVTGEDLLDDIRPYMVRHLGSWLDHGLAAWHHKDRHSSFYTAWRKSVADNLAWLFEDLEASRHHMESLPEDSLDTVIEELRRLGLPRERWIGYLQRLALELPGWSGMFFWRHEHPGYEGLSQTTQMIDYLAVRLVIERIFAMRLCARLWRIEPSIDMLRWYFRSHLSELLVRRALHLEVHLPEYLIHQIQSRLQLGMDRSGVEQRDSDWLSLAHEVWTWQQARSVATAQKYTVGAHAWPLFRLAQHLGLCANDVQALNPAQLDGLFACQAQLDDEAASYIWLRAYENHYRDEIFGAVVANHGRGRWAGRDARPEAQLVFCIDDREEGIRRHLEEINPQLETFGAAGFFGVPINWQALDDDKVTPLCPIVVTPAHRIREVAQPGNEALLRSHRQRLGLRLRLKNYLHLEIRRNVFSSMLAIAVSAPLALANLIGKLLLPRQVADLVGAVQRGFDQSVPTQLHFIAEDTGEAATPEHNRDGFTDQEQADRVQGFLKTIGLQDGFSPLVVMMGHGSGSQNNPHLAAYDCGACSGRHGGPTARVFAAMANRPEIRAMLRERGMVIPDDTWFLGAEHNTCDEGIEWYDVDQLPPALRPVYDKLLRELNDAMQRHAHERCRKFHSAPKRPKPLQALQHVIARANDISQARPELGHATNAAAFVGRRSISYGAFFDRRVFLVSYDPTRDPEGQILENILLAVGPVGAGINLEYYFSTVNNDEYGCGSKVLHNLNGLFGVMEGASSDLRTGLPKQMIEIHEAMRLQLLVEARTEVLTAIYQRQPPIQQLVGNGWLLLSAKDPDSEAIHVFDPAKGWWRWQGEDAVLPQVSHSRDWYAGTMEPLAPALIDIGDASDMEKVREAAHV